MSSTPKVSVNIITHNRKDLLKKAITSVLEQTFSNFELIIVDDASSDGTQKEVSLLKDSRIKYYRIKKQAQVGDVRNKALELSSGKYIALLDDDDLWIDKDKLKKQVDFLDSHPEHILVGTGAVVVDENDQEIYRFLNPQKNREIKNNMLSRCLFVSSSTLFKKEIANKVKGFQTKSYSSYIEDYHFWLELGKYGKLANLPLFTDQVKQHSNQQSNNRRKQTIASFRLIKDYKSNYPNYIKARLRASAKVVLYGYMNMMWLYAITAKIKNKKNK